MRCVSQVTLSARRRLYRHGSSLGVGIVTDNSGDLEGETPSAPGQHGRKWSVIYMYPWTALGARDTFAGEAQSRSRGV